MGDLTVHLTRQEASALSLAAIFGGPSGHRHPELESGRMKLRYALDGVCRHQSTLLQDECDCDEGRRYVALEC